MSDKWKIVRASATGTSHIASGNPCQDASGAQELIIEDHSVMVACVSDGAGSALRGDVGATTACGELVRIVERDGWRLFDDEQCREQLAGGWCRAIRSAIEGKAAELAAPIRQLACTLLGAVIMEESAIFFQIGDGAIVIPDEENYAAVFWPQSGEYANTTNFLTDEDYSLNLGVALHEKRVDELAMFSDGIERLALRFSDRSVHSPFLKPLFATVSEAGNHSVLQGALLKFLDSDAINERTDDDKTLLLAVRCT